MSRAARYIGNDPCPVRLGDRCVEQLKVVTGPPDVVDYLLGRADFEAVDITMDVAPPPEIAPVGRRRHKEE